MKNSGLNGLATSQAVDTRVSAWPRQYLGDWERQQKLDLKNSTLQRDYTDLHAALDQAAQVYRRLCAPRMVRLGEFEIASEIFAVHYLPGDFFTVEKASNGVILALGDICGHGLAAGMWTTHLVGLVGAHSSVSSEPEEIVAGVNRDLCRRSPVAPLASLFLARLDPVTGNLAYCSAGHPPAMLLRASGQLEMLFEGGPLVGVLPEASFGRGSVDLRPGDILVTYSDGILESRNKAEQEFGYDRLKTELHRARPDSADAVLFSVLGAVRDFTATRAPVDDMSLAVIRRRQTYND
jgi:serine phosphatase RsbU (regulator of sigma subunit)